MGNPFVFLLSLIIFLPVAGAILLIFFPKEKVEAQRYFTLLITGAVLVLTLLVFFAPNTLGLESGFEYEKQKEAAAYMQYVFNVPWIPSFDIEYFMGVDGISFPLVMLTALVSMLAMGASWSITKHVKTYCILFLLLETGMLGVFMALDFFLFYVFWEVMLLPMYFLIGVWGGPRREYAAIKFFLYTLVGSVLMLIAILMLYFNSDVRALTEHEIASGNGQCQIKWTKLGLRNSSKAATEGSLEERIKAADERQFDQIGVATRTRHSDEDFTLVFFRKGEMHTNSRLSVSVKQGDGEDTTAVFNAENHSITVSTSAEATVGDVVAAINENDVTNSMLYAALDKGVDGSISFWGTKEEPEGDETAQESSNDEAIELASIAAAGDEKVHTFNLLALAALGQNTEVFDKEMLFGKSLQWWAFILLFIGFIIKVPSVPVHTWLPDAHVEAPTPISMILAGVLLKMGGYGIIRICYPICPHGGYDLAAVVCGLGVVSMVYGAFAALAQKDFKRLVAYSSVSHMGYVVLGFGVWSASTYVSGQYNPDYWNMGVKGAMFQMIGHGISSAGMFFMVGVIYDRVHHRDLEKFGGLFSKMPVYSGLAMGIFFAGLGLPGLCGFIGEVLVVLSVWNYSQMLAVISAAVVIFTAGYILWALQRVYLGAEYKGPHPEALTPSNLRERTIAGTLLVLAILFGVFPHFFVLRYMDATIDRQVQELVDWTRDVKDPAVKQQKLEESDPEVANPLPAKVDDKLSLVKPEDEAVNQLASVKIEGTSQSSEKKSQGP